MPPATGFGPCRAIFHRLAGTAQSVLESCHRTFEVAGNAFDPFYESG